MIPEWFKLLAGAHVYQAYDARREKQVEKSTRVAGCYDSASICAFQSSEHSRGIRGAEIVRSIYGHSVRSDSGLSNFALMAGSRDGQLDGSFANALEFAREWAARDPDNRYVWTRNSSNGDRHV